MYAMNSRYVMKLGLGPNTVLWEIWERSHILATMELFNYIDAVMNLSWLSYTKISVQMKNSNGCILHELLLRCLEKYLYWRTTAMTLGKTGGWEWLSNICENWFNYRS